MTIINGKLERELRELSGSRPTHYVLGMCANGLVYYLAQLTLVLMILTLTSGRGKQWWKSRRGSLDKNPAIPFLEKLVDHSSWTSEAQLQWSGLHNSKMQF